MKRTLATSIIALLCICTNSIKAQRPDFSEDVYFSKTVTVEIGASLGAMNCFTDLGGKKGSADKFVADINLSNTGLAGSIYFTTFYKNAAGLRFESTWGVAKSSDNSLKKEKDAATVGRYERNLNFRTPVFEMMLAAEIHPLYFKHFKDPKKLPRLSPYVTGGIGFFVFNPQTKLNGEWVALQPLRTEGQGFAEFPDRKVYKLKQFNFPVGGGLKYKLMPNLNISAECVYRFLRTDYLDDVSTTYIDKNLFKNYLDGAQAGLAETLYDRQKELNPAHLTSVGDIRGNPGKKDSYFTINFKLGILF